MAYIGKSPTRGVRQRYIYTATGSETSISASDTAKEATGKALSFTDGAYVDVYKNGVLLEPNEAYNTNTANTIAGLSSLSSNDVIEVIVFDIFTTADAVSAYNGGTFSGAVTFDSDVIFEGSMNNRDVTWDKSDMALEFNNNVKAKFGADGGFEIYEAQYGGRIVETSGHIEIRNETDNSDIKFIADNQNGGNATYMKLDGGNGEVQLWHTSSGSSSVKLTTKSTGVDVTGTVNATAFSGDGSALTNLPGSGSAADDITTGDAAVTLATTSGNITIDAQQSDSDIIFKGTDGGVDTTFLTIDGSDAGTLLPNHDIKMPTSGKITTANSGDHLELDSYEGIKLWSRDTDGVAIEYSYGSYWTPVLKFNRRSFGSNPQGVGRIEFNGRKRDNGGGNETDQQYGYIQVSSSDTDTGEASGKMSFYLARDDASKRILELDTQRADWPHHGGILLASDMDIGWYGGNANGTITYLTVAHGNPYSMSDDVTLVLPSVDGTIITTGNLDDINFTDDLTVKTSDGAILKLQTSDTSVNDGDTLGAIEFNAPDETGTDAVKVAASIVAEADDTFNYVSNKTDLVFKLGSSDTATEKVRFTHEGNVEINDGDLVVGTNGHGIDFSATGDLGSSINETLTDYEKGTFTATITGTSGSAGSVAGNTGTWSYIKIGNFIHINGSFNITNLGSYSGSIQITGLPVTAGPNHGYGLGIGLHNLDSRSNASANFKARVGANSTTINIAKPDTTFVAWSELGTGYLGIGGGYQDFG